ncbi:MAG: aminoacyl-tRNA hydrolase [Acidobacteriota bacterium]|nr:aminoacyl-tRNA hydrolase [Acidobacteriota bacterium]MDE3261713.1 aminoacyl-tRNA hydrolase [Acidobacteriota bacterium]
MSDPPPGVPGGSPHETPARVEVPVQIVVGLGNPGVRYEGTRHNIGFEAVAALLGERPVRSRHFDGGLLVEAEIGGREIGLLRPMGYMNRSGGPVRRLLQSEGCAPDEALVVCDDYALPLGTIRTRRRGSDGGHNGLASIRSALGTDDFPRMRLGIGNPPAGEDPADFVLSHFAPQEAAAVDDLLERAVRALETAVGQGIETAMNRFNRAAA